MTNAEDIRNMSNKELAAFLEAVERGDKAVSCKGCMFWKTHHSVPSDEQYACKGCYREDIGEDVEKWLNKEVQDE